MLLDLGSVKSVVIVVEQVVLRRSDLASDGRRPD